MKDFKGNNDNNETKINHTTAFVTAHDNLARLSWWPTSHLPSLLWTLINARNCCEKMKLVVISSVIFTLMNRITVLTPWKTLSLDRTVFILPTSRLTKLKLTYTLSCRFIHLNLCPTSPFLIVHMPKQSFGRCHHCPSLFLNQSSSSQGRAQPSWICLVGTLDFSLSPYF